MWVLVYGEIGRHQAWTFWGAIWALYWILSYLCNRVTISRGIVISLLPYYFQCFLQSAFLSREMVFNWANNRRIIFFSLKICLARQQQGKWITWKYDGGKRYNSLLSLRVRSYLRKFICIHIYKTYLMLCCGKNPKYIVSKVSWNTKILEFFLKIFLAVFWRIYFISC